MSIPKATLAAIQSAGAAVHQANVSLKAVVQAYADQVRATMSSNAFDLQADSLFDEWKTVARLSQTVDQIESELRKVHRTAQQLEESGPASSKARARLTSSVAQTSLSLKISAPFIETIEATDVIVKMPKKTQVTLKPSQASKSGDKAALSSNPLKLHNYLKQVLSSKKFTALKRTQAGVAAGLPSGSVTAAFNKLLENGYLEENASDALKLISKK